MGRTDRLTIRDWLLAEALRLNEEREGRRRDDAEANQAARTSGGAFSRRLAIRAAALPGASDWRNDVRRLGRLARRVAGVLLLLGLVAGVLAARVTVSRQQVDILLAATALLLLPTLMLLVWLGFMIFGGRARGGFGSLLGGLLRNAVARLGPRMLASDLAAEITLASARFFGTAAGRWLLGALTHAFWSVYSIAAIATLVVFFSIAQYDLTWGTTLLRDETVVSLVSVLAQVPSMLGLVPPPSPEWILAGREGALEPEARAMWARLLLGMVAVYGLLPRLVLLALSLLMALASARRLRLDTGQAGYLRLAGALAPEMPRPDGQGRAPAAPNKRTRKRNPAAKGPPVLIALEHSPDHWPPVLAGVEINVLGRADDRAGRRRLLAALEALPPPPALIVLCSMLRTPDASFERFVNRAADAAKTVPVLVVDQASKLTERGADAGARLADWQALAERTGGEALALELEQPDAAILARLMKLTAAEQA